MNQTAQEWIRRLGLIRHPEGGYYREVFRSKDEVMLSIDASTVSRRRSAVTSIYFLLEAPDCSQLHRIDADELWYWHAGSELRIVVITEQGTRESVALGPDAHLQTIVRRGCWFGAELKDNDGWALVSCAVAPGFEFAGFELGSRSELLALYPEQRGVIERLTKP
jgi:predicted cupin superfamily sugar epimerase